MKKEAEIEKTMKRLVKENELSTIFVCDTCKKRLKGMKNVRSHVDKKRHYLYLNPKHPRLRLAIG